ncbi:NADH:ubiquinone reductase (Na(+)-transporting) subunit F [Limisalsivibrio acetivorans]|uniref:NADH:ubiquinone reductase (Na(+)-transporting) subunit F n=1 Tax=Limisalsivibrio acetivorans TaxID=1304888 RepID=UPI0003B47D53|nr:NADH:ubiquinone reductase (Na(+)-transporting) subunit F [Limisalsivibrio acetivorans]
MIEILLGSAVFTLVIILLVIVILFAKSKLMPSGSADIVINGDNEGAIETPVGGKLLGVLANNGIFISSACGGGGSCGECKVKVHEGGGSLLPTEKTHINKKMEREGYRLSCQLTVKEDLKIEVPEEVFSAKKYELTVESNENVATFIKQPVLKLPEGADFDFKAGGYIQVQAPSYEADFKDVHVTEEYRDELRDAGFFDLKVKTEAKVSRAYSMANYPLEKGVLKLNVRIAMPPRDKPDAPPGKGSAYVHSRKPGDKITITGPFGDFYAREGDSEMVFIGGGAGMAPLRSIIFDQLKRVNTDRKISFWYGARNLKELFYKEDFDKLEEEHENFKWFVSMSDPKPEDNWDSYKGYIHTIARDKYLAEHPAPEDCQYYLCGPPPMLASTMDMLDQLGVEPENIFFDDFGS